MPKDARLQNLRSMFIGTGTFAFSENATSAANAGAIGYEDFGNIKAFSPQFQPDKEAVEVSNDGIRVVARNIPTLIKGGYILKSNEADNRNLLIVYGGSQGTPFTQSALSAVAGTVLGFTATPAVIGRWYDLRTSGGVRVRELSAVTITGKVEGTDFILDKKAGRIRFLTAQSADLTPTLSAPAVTSTDAGYLKAITPFAAPIKTGYGRLTIKDKDPLNPLVFDHVDFSCELTLENIGEMGKGQPDIGIMVTITGDIGTVYNRD